MIRWQKRSRTLCATLLAMLWLAASVQADGIQFRYKMEKDRPLIYQGTTTLEQSQTVNGMRFETSIDSREVTRRTLVDTTDEGDLVIEHENLQLAVELDVAQLGTYTFKSSDAQHEEGSVLGGSLTPMYEAMSGAIATVTIRPTGELVKVKGLSDLLKDVLKDNPIAQQFAAGADSQQGLKMNYREGYPEFPQRALEIGDTWSVPFQLTMEKVGTLKGKNTFQLDRKLESATGNVYRILRTSELDLDIDLEINGVKVTGTMAISDSSGHFDFDADRGQLLSSTTTFTLSGDLTVNAGGQTIPLNQKQTQTHALKLLESVPE